VTSPPGRLRRLGRAAAGLGAMAIVLAEPPSALVARLQDVFTKSDGDLKALAVALLDSNEAWQAPLRW